MGPAVFLDRDGTIIFDNGYLKDTSQVILFPETLIALKKLQSYFKLFIITNQSGISKGLTTQEEVDNVNNYLKALLKASGIDILEIFVCSHQTEEACICKKPSAYFIHLAEKIYDLNLSESFIIGDHPTDIECGHNASVKGIYVLTGHGQKHINELKENTIICDNILLAADYIINNKKNGI